MYLNKLSPRKMKVGVIQLGNIKYLTYYRYYKLILFSLTIIGLIMALIV